MTSQGGAAGLGVVFRINTNGTGYTNLHSFTGYPNDGAGPPGSLTLDGSTLYGMTQQGGTPTHNLGMVFKLNTDGSGYTNLHYFAGGTGDGATPQGSLTLANGWLYGMTSASGAGNKGTVFRVSTDGGSYTNFHSFAGGTNDGANPYGCSLMLSGSTLYGMTYYGGTNNYGVIFTLTNLPPPPTEPPTSLAIIYANNQAIVWWPSSVSGCTLQTNNNLAAGTWSNYTGTIINNTVTNSPTQGKLFYRLRYP
jgi:uncharacterized repeat protein (TIGR03803 family)